MVRYIVSIRHFLTLCSLNKTLFDAARPALDALRPQAQEQDVQLQLRRAREAVAEMDAASWREAELRGKALRATQGAIPTAPRGAPRFCI